MSKKTPAQRARRRARNQAAAAQEKMLADNLRANGFGCAQCRHSSTPPTMKKLTCDLDSDFEGYVTVAPDFVCSRFSNKI